MSHKKFGPDRFSRFDVYWIQKNKQTPKQTDGRPLSATGDTENVQISLWFGRTDKQTSQIYI